MVKYSALRLGTDGFMEELPAGEPTELFQCPRHTKINYDKPGTCIESYTPPPTRMLVNCGLDLQPVYIDGTGAQVYGHVCECGGFAVIMPDIVHKQSCIHALENAADNAHRIATNRALGWNGPHE